MSVALSDGTYAVVHVSEVLEGQSFTLNDVKDHIRRELALEQLPHPLIRKHFGKNLMLNGFMGNE